MFEKNYLTINMLQLFVDFHHILKYNTFSQTQQFYSEVEMNCTEYI